MVHGRFVEWTATRRGVHAVSFTFNGFAAPAVVVMLLAFALAWIAFAARPDRVQNRLLAHLLALGADDGARDGGVTPKERVVLDGLRTRLGIADEDATAMEQALLGAKGVG